VSWSYHFGGWELRPTERKLLRRGRAVAVGGRAFDVLLVLLERPGHIVGKDELYERVWPGLAVEPNNLQVQVWALRKLLGAGAITTVARRGYRLATPVRQGADGERGANPPLPADAGLLDELQRHALATLVHASEAVRHEAVRPLWRPAQRIWPGGVWCVDARQLPQQVQARSPDTPSPWQRLLQDLSRQPALLLITEAHLAADASVAAIVQALALAPELHVLSTADRPLGLVGEQVLVPGALPNAAGAAAALALAAPVPDPAASLRWQPRGSRG